MKEEDIKEIKNKALEAKAPLEGPALVGLTIALSLASFMQVLDSTIANVAIPTIAGNLGASSSQGTWVITSFGVANAISLPITGWLAKRVGEVRLFLISTICFVVASFLCGISSSLPMLVAFRILQGFVAGPMMPLSQSLLLANYPLAKRSMALALWSMTVVVAPIFGPILGGYISDNYHWGWIFFINLPIGGVVALLCWKLLRGRETKTERQNISAVALALLVIGIGALQMMLDRGKELDWFNSGEIIVLAVVAVVGITLLIVWELTDKSPIINFSLFASRNFTIGIVCISFGMLIYYGTIVLLPLLLQTQMGYTATLAGFASAPIGILPVLLSPLIGRNAHRLDMRLLASLSFLVFAICFQMRTTFSPLMDFSWVVIPQFVQGLGIAMFFMPLTTIVFSDLKHDQVADASSLFNFMRTLFASIGTSLITTLWERREALHHTMLTEHVNPYNPAFQEAAQRLHSLGLGRPETAAMFAREVTKQGFFIAANEIFYVCSILFFALIIVVWFSKPRSGAVADAGGAH